MTYRYGDIEMKEDTHLEKYLKITKNNKKEIRGTVARWLNESIYRKKELVSEINYLNTLLIEVELKIKEYDCYVNR